jgi:hypothetical protein
MVIVDILAQYSLVCVRAEQAVVMLTIWSGVPPQKEEVDQYLVTIFTQSCMTPPPPSEMHRPDWRTSSL